MALLQPRLLRSVLKSLAHKRSVFTNNTRRWSAAGLPSGPFRAICDPVKNIDGQNVAAVCDVWSSKFLEKGVPDAPASAELLVAHALGRKTLEGMPSWQILSAEHTSKINLLCQQRLKRVPVQYIMQEWDFRDLTLQMEPPVIIPRPETEELIDHIKDHYAGKPDKLTFLEVGCGSGAISISLLHEMRTLTGVAVDSSPKAVALTRKNANNHSVASQLCVECVTFSSQSVGDHILLRQDYDFIVSNPPYVRTSEMAGLDEELSYEDPRGLDGGHDGLDVIRTILENAHRLLKPDGTLWLETHREHPPEIEQLVGTMPSWHLQLLRAIDDQFGQPRFVVLKKH